MLDASLDASLDAMRELCGMRKPLAGGGRGGAFRNELSCLLINEWLMDPCPRR